MSLAFFFLVQLHLSLYVAIKDDVLEHEFIFLEDSLLEVGKLLTVLKANGVEFVHEPQLGEVEGGSFVVLLQEKNLLVLVLLVVRNVLFEQTRQGLHVLPRQGNFEVGLVPLRLFAGTLLQIVQVSQFFPHELLVLNVPNQFQPLLYVLCVHEFVLLQNLFHLRNPQDFFLQTQKLVLRCVAAHRHDHTLFCLNTLLIALIISGHLLQKLTSPSQTKIRDTRGAKHLVLVPKHFCRTVVTHVLSLQLLLHSQNLLLELLLLARPPLQSLTLLCSAGHLPLRFLTERWLPGLRFALLSFANAGVSHCLKVWQGDRDVPNVEFLQEGRLICNLCLLRLFGSRLGLSLFVHLHLTFLSLFLFFLFLFFLFLFFLFLFFLFLFFLFLFFLFLFFLFLFFLFLVSRLHYLPYLLLVFSGQFNCRCTAEIKSLSKLERLLFASLHQFHRFQLQGFNLCFRDLPTFLIPQLLFMQGPQYFFGIFLCIYCSLTQPLWLRCGRVLLAFIILPPIFLYPLINWFEGHLRLDLFLGLLP